MKVVIIPVPMRPPHEVEAVKFPVDGNKALEYEKPVLCPINSVLAKKMKKDEEIKVIYIITTGGNSQCEENKKNFTQEIEGINSKIGAILSYDTIDIEFLPTKKTYNKLITDLAEKIPDNAELLADITFGSKPGILSLFCALRFVEEFREAIVRYIVYGKVEFNNVTRKVEHPMLFDVTSLYYLFKLMGTMGATNADEAAETLRNFFAM
ncbi:MAG: TM1812 family CRISPR-associated protein [Treponema sp.]|nr:TM1812 family CRISPR-associated protein [Treponema sp.]